MAILTEHEAGIWGATLATVEEQRERIRLLAEIATELLAMWQEAEKTCIYEASGHIESSLEGLERDAAWYRRQIQEAQHGRLAITPAGV